jgi:hypothetical protein
MEENYKINNMNGETRNNKKSYSINNMNGKTRNKYDITGEKDKFENSNSNDCQNKNK